jgi:hypothetical protein
MKGDRLIVVGVAAAAAGPALVILGASGSSAPALAGSTVLGAAAITAGLVRRRREPRTAEVAQVPLGPGWRLAAAAGAALALVTLVVGLTVAVGDARGHVFFHMIFGVATLGVFVVLGRLWGRRPVTVSHRALLAVTWLASVGTLLEAIGGAGYDRFNAGRRIPWLTSLHTLATVGGGLAMLAVPIACVVIVVTVIARARQNATVAR